LALPYKPKPAFQNRGRIIKEEPFKVNNKITAKEVRVVGDSIESGVYSLEKALEIAENEGLDLVEISPSAVPPVCKVVDYSKFKYELKKKQKELKSKTAKVEIKEIRFGPNTDEHDYQFKLKHALNFLKEGNKVKAYVNFFGRTIMFQARGIEMLNRFAKELEEVAIVEAAPKLEGKRMFLHLAPKGKK
jgi:translation initiation factor IF-3